MGILLVFRSKADFETFFFLHVDSLKRGCRGLNEGRWVDGCHSNIHQIYLFIYFPTLAYIQADVYVFFSLK